MSDVSSVLYILSNLQINENCHQKAVYIRDEGFTCVRSLVDSDFPAPDSPLSRITWFSPDLAVTKRL